MKNGDKLVGIEFASSTLRAILGRINDFGKIEVLDMVSCECSGIEKGKIINEDDVVFSMSSLIKQLEENTSFSIKSVYINFLEKDITIVQNNITTKILNADEIITQKDLESAILQVIDIEIPKSQLVIDILINKIELSGKKKVLNPVGERSKNISIISQILLTDKLLIKKIVKIFKRVGLSIDGIVPMTIVQKNILLKEQEQNVLLLDIGETTTNIAAFENNNCILLDSLPLGGKNITNDIGICFNLPFELAENIKRNYGKVLKQTYDDTTEIIINKDELNIDTVIKISDLTQIIEARVEEIFYIIKEKTNNIKNRVDKIYILGRGLGLINNSNFVGQMILEKPTKIIKEKKYNIDMEFMNLYSLINFVAISRPYTTKIASTVKENDGRTTSNYFKIFLHGIKEYFYT